MQNLVIRPTLKTLKLTAELEYLFGLWADTHCEEVSQKEIANLAPGIILPENISKFELSKAFLLELAQEIGAKPSLRIEKTIFTDNHNRPIFTAVSPYILEQRLNELLFWTKSEFENNEIHASIICALYHLIFLHLHPLSLGNHSVALFSTWHLCKENLCNSLASISLAKYFLIRSEQYFLTLKQAERSCFADWSTINAWIEFFLEILLSAQQDLIEQSNKTIKLNQTQEKILSFVQMHMPCKREEITKDTGINLATVKYNLGILTKRGCLKRTGDGRASTYSFLKRLG